jgi:aryl-alcohol dehydrogenase-like predicted oxidoreductase
MENSPSFASNIVAEAVDRGINYFDVAPTYGNAQERLGPALEPYCKKASWLESKKTGRGRSCQVAGRRLYGCYAPTIVGSGIESFSRRRVTDKHE